MYQVSVNLKNRKEYINFYSLWAANQKAKEWAKCVDVENLVIVDSETGEVMTCYEGNKLVYVSGIGEIN